MVVYIGGFVTFYLSSELPVLRFIFGVVGVDSFWTAVIVTWAVVWSLAVFVRYMNLKHRSYNFYKDRVEFQEGFLNIDQKTVSYDKVTDITLRKSVWDRIFGAGTITVATPGTVAGRGFLNYGAGGIAIQYVETPDDEYKFIQKLVQKK